MRARIGNRRVLALVVAFLRAAILGEGGGEPDTETGPLPGAILSPLLARIALSVLDDRFVAARGQREQSRAPASNGGSETERPIGSYRAWSTRLPQGP